MKKICAFFKRFTFLVLAVVLMANTVPSFAETTRSKPFTCSNEFLAPSSYMPHAEAFMLNMYYKSATDLLKKQNKLSKVFSRYNNKKITASVYMLSALKLGLNRLVKLNKFMAKAYDTTDPEFYSSAIYKEYRAFLKDTTKILEDIRSIFKTKDLTFTKRELFGDAKKGKGLIDQIIKAGIVRESRADLIDHIQKTLARHKVVAVPTYFGELKFHQEGDLIYLDVDQLIPTDLNSFLKRGSDRVLQDLTRGGRRSSVYQTRVVMGHKKPDSDASISSMIKAYMGQYMDASKGYLSRVNVPVLLGEPNNETNFILEKNGVKKEFFIQFGKISTRLMTMLKKLSLKVDTEYEVFDDVTYDKLIDLAKKKHESSQKFRIKKHSWIPFLNKIVGADDFSRLDNRHLNILAKRLFANSEDNMMYIRHFASKQSEVVYDIILDTLTESKDVEILQIIRNLYAHYSDYFPFKTSASRRFKSDLADMFDSILNQGYPIHIKNSKSGRVERTTWKNRLAILQGVLADNMKDFGLKESPKIVDVGCSNGITTNDMADILDVEGIKNASITGSDIAMEYFEVTDKNGNKAFLDAFGNLLQITHGGKVYAHTDYDLRAVFANVFVKDDIVDVKSHNVVSPEVVTDSANEINFETGDIFDTYEEKVDVITVFDVLKIYYDKEQIEDALVKMGNNLKEGGLLMRGNRYTNGYTSYAIYQRRGDKLVLVKRSGHIDDDKSNMENQLESEFEQKEDLILSAIRPSLAKEIDLTRETPNAFQTPILKEERVISYLQNNYASKRKKTTIGLTDNHMYEADELKTDDGYMEFLDSVEDHHPMKAAEKEFFDKHLPAGWDKDPAYNIEKVGATCTILAAKMLKEMPLLLTTQIANLLLSAILSDTMGFYAPTTTKKDFEIARALAEIAGVEDIDAFFAEQSRKAYTIKGRGTADVIFEDYKESYTPEAGLAQIFVNGFEEFDAIAQETYSQYKGLLEDADNLRFIALTVTDAQTKDSRLYMVVKPEAEIESEMLLEEFVHSPAISVAIINSDALRPFVKGDLSLDETVDKIMDYFIVDSDLTDEISDKIKDILSAEKVELYMLPSISERIYDLLITEYSDTNIDAEKIKNVVYSLSRSHSINRDGFKEYYLNLPGVLSRKKEIAPPVVSFYERMNANILEKAELPQKDVVDAFAAAA